MLGQTVDIFIMAGKRKQLSNDITNVIVEMRKSGYKLQEITDTLNIRCLFISQDEIQQCNLL
jgi:hypothetical protein